MIAGRPFGLPFGLHGCLSAAFVKTFGLPSSLLPSLVCPVSLSWALWASLGPLHSPKCNYSYSKTIVFGRAPLQHKLPKRCSQGVPWGSLGDPLGALWAPLGSLWAPLGPPLVHKKSDTDWGGAIWVRSNIAPRLGESVHFEKGTSKNWR